MVGRWKACFTPLSTAPHGGQMESLHYAFEHSTTWWADGKLALRLSTQHHMEGRWKASIMPLSTAPHGDQINTAPHGDQINTAPHGDQINTAPHGGQTESL